VRNIHDGNPRGILSAARIKIDRVGAAMMAGMFQNEMRHQRICHFMKSKHCSSLLSSSRLWLRRSDLFNDEEEGLFAKSPLMDPLRSAFPGVILESSEEELRAQQRIDRMTRFIHCWFASEPETKNMWKDYGDEGRGVCLLSSTTRLLPALQPVKHMSHRLHAVTYLDANNAVMELHSSLPYCRKRTKYANEKEVRLLATMALEHPYLNQDTLPDGEWPNHMLVDVNLGLMLEGIVLGASMEREVLCEIREQASLCVPGITITHSQVAACEQAQHAPRTGNSR
jgi:hypothetical protein